MLIISHNFLLFGLQALSEFLSNHTEDRQNYYTKKHSVYPSVSLSNHHMPVLSQWLI